MDRISLPGDLDVYHVNLLETCFLYSRIFDDRAYLQQGIALEPGACVFDVGANIGLTTLFVHRTCPGARVFAFEPIPATFEVLRANVELHGVDASLFACGLADRDGTETFRAYTQASVSSGAFPDAALDRALLRSVLLHCGMAPARVDNVLNSARDYTTIACPVRSLSAVIAEERIETIDLLKIVAEKSECRIVDGIGDDDWPRIRQAVVEVHDVDGRLPGLCARFRARGFRVATLQEPRFRETHVSTLFATRS